MKSEKILHIVTVSFVINHFFGKQFLYLKNKNGYEYHLGCSPSKDLKKFSIDLGFIPFEVEITKTISPLKDIKAIFEILRYIKSNEITKVVGHTPKGGMIAMLASFLAGIPDRIYFRHGIIYETSTGFKRVLLRNIDKVTGFLATKVVCVSNSVKNISLKDKLNHPGKNIVLGLGTCNGIDTEGRFNPQNMSFKMISELKKELEISPSDKVVGYVGRLVRDKGIDDLIYAWKLIKLNSPKAKLLLVGPIEEKDCISEYSRNQIDMDPTIIFVGYVIDASPYFSLMDVFVLPTYREGFSTVALEASSMRLPVLITKATGCIESIIENKTGLFISNEPQDIAEKVIYYLDNRENAQLHGGQGRIFVQENFEQVKIWNLIAENLKI